MNKQELIKRIKDLPFSYIWNEPYLNKEVVLETIKHIDEPKKVVVPQFVADWIDYFKKYSGILYGSIAPYSYYGHAITDDFVGDVKKTLGWIRNNSETYARAWLDGYEVDEEPKYTVKIKATKHYFAKDGNGRIYFSLKYESAFTKIELEKVNLGWVFDCEGIEIEEVE
jgi:hypothetical protein